MLNYILDAQVNNVRFESGNVYRFNYKRFQNDPQPLVIFLNSFRGTHPNTGHPWLFIQAINLNYLPRKDRQMFIRDWENVHKRTNKRVKITWDIIKRWYPYLQFAIRRYFHTPADMMTNIVKIDAVNYQKEVVRDFWKDYSMEVRRRMMASVKRKRGM